MSTVLNKLHASGQAVWLDYIRRSFLDNGEFKALLDKGVRGVTSNPSIFERAMEATRGPVSRRDDHTR